MSSGEGKDNVQQTLGRSLRQAREEQGRSLEEVEQAIARSTPTTSKRWNGETSRPCPAVCGPEAS
jgi:transcriptional regulator with XRE-family HTH domain